MAARESEGRHLAPFPAWFAFDGGVSGRSSIPELTNLPSKETCMSKLDDAIQAAAHPLDPEVKDRIDALTAHFRLGDAER